MTCTEFRDRYTEFRDGLISAARELRRFERHLARCAACAGYDAALRDGVRALQGAGTIEPSAGFRRRLDVRLRAERLQLAEPPLRAHARSPRRLVVSRSTFIPSGGAVTSAPYDCGNLRRAPAGPQAGRAPAGVLP